MKQRYPGIFFSQFTGAELVADKWNLSREDLDQFALESHQKAANATESNFFDREILPVKGKNAEGIEDMVIADEGIRFDASFDKFCLSWPSPISQRVTFLSFAIALISTSNPFLGTNLPLAVIMKLEAGVLRVFLLTSLN